MIPSDLRQKAKNGHAAEAYELLCQSDIQYGNLFDQENAGWIVFYYIKEADYGQIDEAIEKYLSLGVPRPSLLHSNMLRLIGKRSKEIQGLPVKKHIKSLGIDFREEDYQGTLYMGRNIPALAESVFADCYEDGMNFAEATELFLREEMPERDNIDWIFRNYSKCTYRRLWQYNQDEDDEIKSYALVRRYLDETSIVEDRRGEIYSAILNSIIWDTNNSTLSAFKDIFENWGMNSFIDKDWQKVRKDDDVYDSLAEKAITKYIKSLKLLKAAPSGEFEELINNALRHYPDDETYLRYKTKYLMKAGNCESAAEIYKKMIINGNKYYLWSELSEIVRDRDLKAACLAKAILLQKDDNFLGNIRLIIASMFIDNDLYSEAAHELKRYEDTYNRNSWGLKQAFYTLKSRIPDGTKAAENNISIYKKFAQKADEYLYSDLPVQEAVLVRIKSIMVNGVKKKRFSLLCHDGSFIETNPKVHGISTKAETGTLFDMKIDTNGKKPKVVWMKEIGKLEERLATIDNINKAKGIFHLQGENDASYIARLDKSSFTPTLGTQVHITAFRINKPGGRAAYKILRITQL